MTAASLDPEPREIRPIELLHLSYTTLREAWAAHLLDQSRDLNAPGFVWKRGAEDEPISEQTELLQVGELIAVDAGTCAPHSLRTLVKAYAPDRNSDGSLARHAWPGTAAFCLGRGILEATATVVWLMDPSLTSDERLCRSARIALWSAKQDRRELPAPARTFDDWKAAAVKAGLQVNDKDRWKVKVGQEGNLEAFSHTNVVKAAFGTAGADSYGLWSAASRTKQHGLSPSGERSRCNPKATARSHTPTWLKTSTSTSPPTSPIYWPRQARRSVPTGAATVQRWQTRPAAS